jgi:hypothetical protein
MNIEDRYKGRYVPKGLSPSDRKKQIESIKKGTIRPKVDYPHKESNWTQKAKKYFKGDTSIENISNTINVPIKALKQIIKKGEKAYYSSGSRPNIHPVQWAYARLYSLLFGNPTIRNMDKKIVEKYNIPILKGGNILNPSVQDIERKKEYFDNDIEDFFNIISYNRNNLNIIGSYDNRAFFYPADIDLIEVVNISNINNFVKWLKNMIRIVSSNNNMFIMDIKMGSVKKWEIVDESAYIEGKNIYGYDATKSKEKLKELLNNNIITKDEYNKWNKLLINKPNEEQLALIKKEIRPNLLRWTIKDILKGFLKYRGFKITIKDAIKTGGLFKMDFILITDDKKIMDINNVWDFRIKGLKNENGVNINPERELMNEAKTLKTKGQYFKALKRLFSYYKLKNNKKLIEKLYKILNSDIGLINQISSNIELLILLLTEKKPKIEDVNIFIDGFIDRLNHIFTLKDYFKNEKLIINSINKIIETKSIKLKVKKLEILKNKIDSIKNTNSKKYLI